MRQKSAWEIPDVLVQHDDSWKLGLLLFKNLCLTKKPTNPCPCVQLDSQQPDILITKSESMTRMNVVWVIKYLTLPFPTILCDRSFGSYCWWHSNLNSVNLCFDMSRQIYTCITPLKINMEHHHHGGLVPKLIFPSFHGWFVGSNS